MTVFEVTRAGELLFGGRVGHRLPFKGVHDVFGHPFNTRHQVPFPFLLPSIEIGELRSGYESAVVPLGVPKIVIFLFVGLVFLLAIQTRRTLSLVPSIMILDFLLYFVFKNFFMFKLFFDYLISPS